MFQWIKNRFRKPKPTPEIGARYKEMVLSYPRIEVRASNGKRWEYYRLVRTDSAGMYGVKEDWLNDLAFLAKGARMLAENNTVQAVRLYAGKIKILPISEIDAQLCEVSREELSDTIFQLLTCSELSMDDIELETEKLISKTWDLLQRAGYAEEAEDAA
jgi:hypothetical protein